MAPKLKTRHLMDLVAVADPRLAPRPPGEPPTRAVVTVTDVVPGEGTDPPRYRSRLALLDLTTPGASPRTLTFGERDRAPRWSPDGRRLAFLRSERDASGGGGPAQLAVLDLDGGEARVLTSGPNPVTLHAWEDDEHVLAVGRGDRVEDDVKRGLGRVIDRRTHRFDGVGFLPPAEVDLVRVSVVDGRSRRLATLEQTPSELVVAPSGRRLAYLAPGDDREQSEGWTRLWTRRLGAKRAADAEDLLGRPVRARGLAWAPDGSRLAFVAPSDLVGVGRAASLWISRRGGGSPRRLTADVDVAPSVGGDARVGAYPTVPRWTADGRGLVVVLNRSGRSELARVGLGRNGAPVPLAGGGGDRVVTAFDGDDDWAVQLVETPTTPGEAVLRGPDGAETRLTSFHDAWTARFDLVSPVERHVRTGDGTELAYHWWAPARPRSDGAFVVQIHGGPHTNDGFGFRFEFQRLAAAGYAVVSLNPRGASSFGEGFATAAQGAYGTVDADDVMAVVEHAATHHHVADAPIHLTGGSYGGFMTNWLVGAHPQRFRSAVTQRSICNWISFFGTSDIGPWFTEGEVGAAPWIDLDALWRASPLRRVAEVVTPTLVLHSEDDHRCPIEQAEQWFTALKRLGRAETRLVRFPGEGHELSRSGRPDRRIQRIDLILDWFERHA